MLGRIFPSVIDNTVVGNPVSLVILGLVGFIKLVMGFNFSGLNPFVGAADILTSVDKVPLASFPPDAATAVVASAESWGMVLFVLALLCLLAVFRYRGLVPLMFVLLLFEDLAGRVLAHLAEPERPLIALTAPSMINWGFLLLLASGLALCLVGGRRAPAPA